jgi:hypothetical protein
MVDQYEIAPAVEARRCAWIDEETGARVEADLDEIAVFSATGNVIEFPTGKPIDPAPSVELIPVEITCFVKESGLLTKKIRLAADGTTVIDSSEWRMSGGTMESVLLADWRQLATGIDNLPSNTAIALGRMRPDFPDKVYLTTKDAPDCSRPGFAARTGEKYNICAWGAGLRLARLRDEGHAACRQGAARRTRRLRGGSPYHLPWLR